MNSLVADAAGLDLFLSYLNFPFVFLISLNILKLFFILLIIMPESVSCGTLQLFVENLGSLSTSSFSSSELEPIPGMWYCFRSSTMSTPETELHGQNAVPEGYVHYKLHYSTK